MSDTIKNVEPPFNSLKIDHTQKQSIRYKIVNHIWGVRNSSTRLTKIGRVVREKINVTKTFKRKIQNFLYYVRLRQ